jgi:hypothetical protein
MYKTALKEYLLSHTFYSLEFTSTKNSTLSYIDISNNDGGLFN